MGLVDLYRVSDGLLDPNKVNLVLDIGAKDCKESVELAKKYPNALVYAYECNPQTIPLCQENIKEIERVKLFTFAVSDTNGTTKFYPINTKETITTHTDGNPGASSLFRASGAYDHIERYVQDEIEVETKRLDSVLDQAPDVIWMDLQGAELLALKGLGNLLDGVKIIHTEVEMNEMYTGQALFKDIDPYLTSHGFIRAWGNLQVQFGTDVIYIHSSLLY